MPLTPYANAIIASESSEPPSQIVFSVDDAWLHEGCWIDGVSKAPAVDAAFFEDLPVADFAPLTTKACCFPQLRQCLDSQTADQRPPDDIEFAQYLIEFCTSKRTDGTSRNYGLCLCSFEWFYKNFSFVNSAENAVLFDIRHQYMADRDKKACLEAWKQAEQAAMSSSPWRGSDTLGWYLYFRIKLATEDDPTWPAQSIKIDANHLLIVTSNPNPDRTLEDIRPSLIAAALDNGKSWLDCAHLILPKSFQPGTDSANHYKRVFELFDRTFKDAAKFETKKQALYEDMKILWEQPSEPYAHVENETAFTRLAMLQSGRWIRGEAEGAKAENVTSELRALFRPKKEDSSRLRASTFWNLLQHLVPAKPTEVVYQKCQCILNGDGLTDIWFLPAIAPGAFLVLGMAQLVGQLRGGKHKGEQRPPCTISICNCNSKLKVQIALSGESIGFRGFFQKRYGKGRSASGGAGALCDLLSGCPAFYGEFFDPKVRKFNQSLDQMEEALLNNAHGGMNGKIGWAFKRDTIELVIDRA